MKILTSFLVVVMVLFPSPGAAVTKVFLSNLSSNTVFGAAAHTTATGAVLTGCADDQTDELWAFKGITTSDPGSTGTQETLAAQTNTAPPCYFASGTAIWGWITPPVSSGFTLSGNIDFSVNCQSSNNAMNAGYGFQVWRWSKREGGLDALVMVSGDSTECSGTRGNRTVAAAAPTSTTMATGDRLFFIPEVRNVGGGWGGNGSRTLSFWRDHNGTFVNFVDTFTFSADSYDISARPAALRVSPRYVPTVLRWRAKPPSFRLFPGRDLRPNVPVETIHLRLGRRVNRRRKDAAQVLRRTYAAFC